MSFDPPDEHADCSLCPGCGVHECECRCPDEPTGPVEGDAYRVVDFETGETLDGQPSIKLLLRAHRKGEDAVPAYCDEHKVWHYVAPEQQEREMRAGRDVVAVYVRAHSTTPRPS